MVVNLDNVENCKTLSAMVERRTGIVAAKIRMQAQCKELVDGMPLSAYGFQDGSTVQAMLRLSGGTT